MGILVQGFAADNAVPDSYRASVFGAGLISVASLPIKVACLGNKITAGTATADQDIVPITSEADADSYLGAGSECATVAYGALSVGGVSVYAAPVAEATAGAVSASLTIAFGGAATRNGTIYFRCGGKAFNVGVTTTDATTLIATNCDASAKGVVRAGFTSGVTSSTVTLTWKQKGIRGNHTLLWWDASDAPGVTVTVTGGTAIHSNLVPFNNGAGADSVANVLALLTSDVYDFIASPHNDTTNMGLIKTHLASEALPGISHLENAIYAIFGTYAAATSLSTSTLNDQRSTLVWSTYLEDTPAWWCGKIAALRASVVGSQPNNKWAGILLSGAQAHAFKGDSPNKATQKLALNNGLCVLESRGADVYLVRGIVTKCLTNSSADFRTRDWTDVDVTDRINKEVGALWTSVSTANPWAAPDSTTGNPPSPGDITPSLWTVHLANLMATANSNGWVYLNDVHPPQSEWDNGRKCIMSAIPVYVKPKSFQLGANINQTVA